MTTKFRTIYTHDRAISALFATHNTEPSLTNQAEKNDTDINVIMARYGQTGQLPQINEPAQYGDFSEVTDYRGAMDKIREANELFAEIPAKVRARFHNDPGEFLEFAMNPENLDEMRKLGLAPPAKNEETPTTPQEPPAPPITPTEYDDNGTRPRQAPAGAAGSATGRPGQPATGRPSGNPGTR